MEKHQSVRSLFRVLPVGSEPIGPASVHNGKVISIPERVAIAVISSVVVILAASLLSGHWVWSK